MILLVRFSWVFVCWVVAAVVVLASETAGASHRWHFALGSFVFFLSSRLVNMLEMVFGGFAFSPSNISLD